MLIIRVETRQEQSQIRPIDNPRIVGSYQKILRDLGWKPTIPFEQSLHSMYQYWEERIKDEVKMHTVDTP
jgi:GDP-4-dehydro-6-deoxy-D-mannose reductase